MSEWIKCSDRLPEYDELVLTFDPDFIQTGYLCRFDEWTDSHGYSLVPTHWQPLPKPPEDL